MDATGGRPLYQRLNMTMNTETPIEFVVSSSTTPTPRDQIEANIANPAFGRVFTDHMATLRWSNTEGWHDAKVEARRPFQIDPSCAVLHYAQEIFEGMK